MQLIILIKSNSFFKNVTYIHILGAFRWWTVSVYYSLKAMNVLPLLRCSLFFPYVLLHCRADNLTFASGIRQKHLTSPVSGFNIFTD